MALALGSHFSAQANDQVILESARSTATGQAWFNYLTQCSDCGERREALGQLQLKQYEANGDMQIEGAATGAAGAGDTALLDKARETDAAQDWYNYLSQCGSCEARGEALGAMQALQLANNGDLDIDAVSSVGGQAAGGLSAPNISTNSGDENSLADAALTNGSATDWYSYLVGCSECGERKTALNAMQQLQYASNGDAFNSDLSWAPGETLEVETPATEFADADAVVEDEFSTVDIDEGTVTANNTSDSADAGAEAASADAEEDIAANETEAEAETAADTPAEDSPEESLAGGDIAFNEPTSGASEETSPEESLTSSVDFDDNAPEGDSWELALEISGHSRAVWRVAFSPVAPLLASASGDRTVLLYDLNARDIKHRLTAHQGYVNAIAFSPDGKQLASGGGDRAIIIWDVASGAALRVLQGHAGDINALAWSASGDLVVSGSDDGRVLVWDSQTGKRVSEMSETGSDVTALAISPDEKTVATAGSDGHVYLFNTQDGKQTGTLDSHDGYTFDLAWSVDGASLSGAGSDGVIRQWQLGNSNAAEAVAQQSQSITGIDFSANGKYLASSSFNGDVVIRDANSFAKVQRIRAYPGSAYSVSMTGDGRFVAAAGGVNFIRVWRR
jgi:WD40 repeat protein